MFGMIPSGLSGAKRQITIFLYVNMCWSCSVDGDKGAVYRILVGWPLARTLSLN
jgi:hypothetical protein